MPLTAMVHPMNILMPWRFEALLPHTIEQATLAFSLFAKSVGGGAVNVLSAFHDENGELCRLRRGVLSETRKQTLVEIGWTKMVRSVGFSVDNRDDKKVCEDAIRLGMNITLVGGWEKCQDWVVSKIEEEAARVRREGGLKGGLASVVTRQAAVEKMRLCDPGDSSGAMTYSLGHGDRYIAAWDAAGTTDKMRDNWRKLIRE